MTKRSRPISATPLRDRARCDACGETVDVRANGVGEIVHGVAINRAQGGANQVALMQRQGRWLCKPCIESRRARHVPWTQLDLFES